MSTKDILSGNRNQFDIRQCIINSNGFYTEIFAVIDTIFLDIIDADLTSLGNGQFVCNYTLSRKICFSKLSISDKHIVQSLLYCFYSERTRCNGLHIERRHCIVECLAVVRYDGTRFDIRLSANAGFHNTSVETDTFIVDEEAVCSTATGEASVLIDSNKVIGAEIILAVHIFQFEKYGIIDLTGADRRRIYIQNTGARTVCQIIELLFLFVKNLNLDMRERIADGGIIAIGRCNNTSATNL